MSCAEALLTPVCWDAKPVHCRNFMTTAVIVLAVVSLVTSAISWIISTGGQVSKPMRNRSRAVLSIGVGITGVLAFLQYIPTLVFLAMLFASGILWDGYIIYLRRH